MEEVRQERERLQEKFLSHVSHELRTPLTAIFFFITNVLDGIFGEVPPEQREQLSLALDNVMQLKDMVSDLLDITRVETNKLALASRPANLVRLIAEVLNTCRADAEGKGISLRCELIPDLPLAWVDPARVRQILTNLLDNGIKFTPEGGALIVRGENFSDDSDFVLLSISDTGCGISPDNCRIIFDRLAQVKSSAETSRHGLGLGLFITKELVSRHGGRIWVDSELGRGSTFHFTLPVFSLSQWCARVLVAPSLETGCVTLIAVDVFTSSPPMRSDLTSEIKRALERCVLPGRDVILPSTGTSEFGQDQVETVFIVACTGPAGSAVIENRIQRELQSSIIISRFQPIVSSTTVPMTAGAPREKQIDEIAREVERLVREHFLSGKNSGTLPANTAT
jgi:hypothetical protein